MLTGQSPIRRCETLRMKTSLHLTGHLTRLYRSVESRRLATIYGCALCKSPRRRCNDGKTIGPVLACGVPLTKSITYAGFHTYF